MTPRTWARGAGWATGGALAAGGAALAYAGGYEVRSFRLREATLPVLPPGQRPMRVLHLSDLHVVPSQQAKLRWVRELARLEPDLVVSTGDHLAHREAVPAVLDAMGDLLERPGVFVFGSNDYYAPVLKNPARYLVPDTSGRRAHGPFLPWEDLRDAFLAEGWIDLNNARDTLEVDGRLLELVGVDDPHLHRDRYDRVAGAPRADVDLAVGVTHAPYLRVLDAMHADGLPLILAGHTHGGQLCVPGFGALVTNCDLDRGRARGVSRHPLGGSPSASWMNVSAGLGTSPFAPVRFACPPEASLLTLVAAPRGSGVR